jgi:hypothetical protein
MQVTGNTFTSSVGYAALSYSGIYMCLNYAVTSSLDLWRRIAIGWSGKAMERSGHGLISGRPTIPAFTSRDWENPRKVSHNSLYLGRDFNPEPPEYKTGFLTSLCCIIRSFEKYSLRFSVSKEPLMDVFCPSVCLSAASFSRDHTVSYQWSYELHILPCNYLRTTERISIKSGIGDYAIGDLFRLVIFNFPQSIITMWQVLRIVRWENDIPRWHYYPWSSATTDGIARAANHQWPHELSML